MWFWVALLKNVWTPWGGKVVTKAEYVKLAINFSALMLPTQKSNCPSPWLLYFWPRITVECNFFLPFYPKISQYSLVWPQYTFPLCDGSSQILLSPDHWCSLWTKINITLFKWICKNCYISTALQRFSDVIPYPVAASAIADVSWRGAVWGIGDHGSPAWVSALALYRFLE